MLSTYNRTIMRALHSPEELKVYYNSAGKVGLEWNQYIGRVIINDFIKQLDDKEGTDFAAYMPVLAYIEYGLFQSAIRVIQDIDIPGVETAKAWLLKALAEGEDRYE